jgi:hypothetical protein
MSDAERIASFIALADEELTAARSLTSVAPRQAASSSSASNNIFGVDARTTVEASHGGE